MLSGLGGDSGLTWLVCVPQESAFAGTRDEVPVLSREAVGKKKEISLPLPPLLCLSQISSRRLELQTHCSYLMFVEPIKFVSVKIFMLPSRL